MPENLEERIDRLEDRAGPCIESDDFPNSHNDPSSYYTDEDGHWDHEKQLEHLLAERGPPRSPPTHWTSWTRSNTT